MNIGGASMHDSEELRQEILKLVKEFSIEHHKVKPFEPGQTYIPSSGKVFGYEEVQSLVSTSLDFWLTAGPEAEKFERSFSKFLGIYSTLKSNFILLIYYLKFYYLIVN